MKRNIFITMAVSALSLTAKENITHFTSANGLVSDSLSFGILDDSQDHIWLAYNEASVDQGVAYFDGSQWTRIQQSDGLPSNFVWDIDEDANGNLWFEHKWSYSLFDGTDWIDIDTSNGLANGRPRDLYAASNGDVWINYWDSYTNAGGVSLYRNGEWTYFDTSNGLGGMGVTAIKETKDGTIWAVYDYSEDVTVSRFDGSSWIHYSKEDGLADEDVRRSLTASDGSLWVTGTSYDCSQFKDGEWRTFGDDISDPRAIKEDLDGNIWMDHGINGVQLYNGETWERFWLHNKLEDSNVGGLEVSSKGVYVWYTREQSNGINLSVYKEGEWTHLSSNPDNQYNEINRAVADAEGNLWITYEDFDKTDTLLSKYDGTTWTHFTANAGLPAVEIDQITASKSGDIWLSYAEGGGVVRITDESGASSIVPGTLKQKDELTVSVLSGKLQFNQAIPEGAQVRLINFNGRQVFNAKLAGNSLLLPPLSRGIYFVQVQANGIVENIKVSL